MSVVLNFDDKPVGHLQRGCSQMCAPPFSGSLAVMRIRDQLKYLYRTVVEVLMKDQDLQWLLSIFCAAAVLLDYLFAYIPVINNDKKCILLDKSLGIIAVAFRVALDFLFILIILSFKFNFKFKFKLQQEGAIKTFLQTLKEKMMKSKAVMVGLLLQQFINVLLFSPVVQLMVVMIITSERKERMIFPALNSLLGLHVPRLAAVIKLLLKTLRSPSSRFSTKLAYLFAFIYIYSSQLFAALWYILAIKKETQCWERAYKNLNNNSYDIFNCSAMNPKDYNYVSDYCSNDTTIYDFGIYGEIHQSGILEKKSSALKILYFSRWGLQSLSSFAQGLKAGVDVSGNIFVIFVMVSGVVMFCFLIGEVQSQRERIVKMKLKLLETDEWMSTFKNLSEDLKSEVKKYQKYAWQETKGTGANIENLLHNLPEKLRREMTYTLCRESLRKVKEFDKWSEASLKELCNYLKPVFYYERTHIIREGDPISEIVFVIHGKLWSYPSGDRTMGSPSTSGCNRKKIDHLKEGDFNGKELVNWVWADPYSYDHFPISTKTIQTVTNVEAFVLTAYDLKNIFIRHHAFVFIKTYWHFRSVLRSRRKKQALAEKETPQAPSQQY